MGSSPVGTLSVTVTMPTDGGEPGLLTVIVKVAPICPCLKSPEWLFVTVRSGPGPIVVMSSAVLLLVLTSPPPETIAVFVSVGGAAGATFTVRVIAG